MTDAVYLVGGPVHQDRSNLRYSLRSLATNAPWIDTVWIIGDCPEWFSDQVHTIPLEPRPEKFANQRASLTAAVNHPDMADTVIIANDDHYIVEPVPDPLPLFHCGPTSHYIQNQLQAGVSRGNTWLRAVQDTATWMTKHGHRDPYCYENHTPLTFDRALLAATIADYPTEQRLAYPGLHPLAGTNGPGIHGGNVKVKTDTEFQTKLELAMPFVSSTDTVFQDGAIGRHIRTLFPNPSQYEAR